jgi:hypothetical protein
MIWDFERFFQILNNDTPLFEESEIIPSESGIGYFTFGYIKFNIRSTIHSDAVIGDILMAHKHFGKHFPLLFGNLYGILNSRLVDGFVSYFKENTLEEFMTYEPNVLEIIRLCYWHYKCDLLSSTFYYKNKEIRRKIYKGILDLFKPYYESVSYDNFANDYEFNRWVEERVKEFSPERRKDKRFVGSILELLRVLKSINSELMLAWLCHRFGNISFDTTQTNGHDYDYIINGTIGVQVKTPFPVYDNKRPFFKKVEELEVNGNIAEDKLEKEFWNYIFDINQVDKIDKAIEQGAKIIFFNLSNTHIGYAMERHIVESNKLADFEKSLAASIDLANQTEYLPLIIFLSRTNVKYNIIGTHLKVPITKDKNKIKLDRARVQGFK